jgi:uncharacterized protein YbjT (DUF2867 family)
MKILITGATGYIGGLLVPELLDKGHDLRVLVRDPSRLNGRIWNKQVEIVTGDVLDRDSLQPALQDVHTAYYLIHSMKSGVDFHQRDREAAHNFGQVAKQTGVQRIVYLGGLGDTAKSLSPHLRSRQQTGEILNQFGVQVLEFRAGVIVGPGSLSFEMIRYLTERVPIMICPRWVFTKAQPLSVRDVLAYLLSALELPSNESQIIEIGGPEVLSYGDMLRGYASVRELRRWILPVPVLSPALSSYWVHWVTPIPANIARPLIEGLKNEVILQDDKATQLFPAIKPISYHRAVEIALGKLEQAQVETAWSDSLASSLDDRKPVQLTTQEGLIIERREILTSSGPETLYQRFTSLGGSTGWLYANWAWRLRGILDRMVGGVGFRRGRRHPRELRVGDALDFWRVEKLVPGHMLRLRAEMKLPGKAWLQFETHPDEKGSTSLIQTAYFAPKGLLGFLYWYVLYPIHRLIFSGLVKAIAQQNKFVEEFK